MRLSMSQIQNNKFGLHASASELDWDIEAIGLFLIINWLKTNDVSKLYGFEFKKEFIFGHGYALYYFMDEFIRSLSLRFVLTEPGNALHLLQGWSIEV